MDISGDNNTTTITGNVNIDAHFESGDKVNASDTLNGIIVDGNNNNVTLDGTLSLDMSDRTSADSIDTFGLDVTGAGNTVNIEHGIQLKYSSTGDSWSLVSGINIDGASTVTLSGDSLLELSNIPGGGQILADIRMAGS